MATKLRLVLLLVLAAQIVYSIPIPEPGTENVQVLMQTAEFVAKGEVLRLAPVGHPSTDGIVHVEATVRIDRVYKGSEDALQVLVRFVRNPRRPSVQLVPGDYVLLFLTGLGEGRHALADEFFGALPISPVLATSTTLSEMQLLEADLKAAITLGSRTEVLNSVRMLGNMRSISSTEELVRLLPSPDIELQAEVFLALLQLGDYRLIKETTSFLQRPAKSQRARWIQSRISRVVASVHDPALFPQMVELAHSNDEVLRLSAFRALRNMRVDRSIPLFISRLSDSEWLIRYTVMAALAELTEKPEGWVPPILEFKQVEAKYIARWKEWWDAEGSTRYENLEQRK